MASSSSYTSMAESVELVHKLIRILRARGMPSPQDDEDDYDFGPLEQALGCSMPDDYKVLVNSLPRNTYIGFGMQVDIGFQSPSQILETHQELLKGYQDPRRIELDWSSTKAASFVPIADNSSAFYFGYVKENNALNKLICLDGEGNLEWNGESATMLPLGVVLYRMIVRAVTHDIWEDQGSTLLAARFWWSEGEAADYNEGMTVCARDGSNDHEASDEHNYVVLGRRVASTGSGEWDEEDEEDYEEDGNVFDGASEDDFMGVGEYGLTHPLDSEEEDRQNAVQNAVKVPARVKLPEPTVSLKDLGFDESVYASIDPKLNQAFARALLVENCVAVGHRAAAFVAKDGRLALVDYEDERFVFMPEPNGMLEANEQFTHVAFDGNQNGFAFTSQGRLLGWKGYGKYENFTWIPLLDDMGPIRQLAAQENNLAIVLQDGRVIFRGAHAFCHAGPNKPHTPYYLGGVEKAVRVYVSYSKLFILHADGSVSTSSKSNKLKKLTLPVPIVALCCPGQHVLFLANNGCVYGYGQDGKGTLPRAVTAERIAKCQESQDTFDQKAAEIETRLEEFSSLMTEHLRTCPQIEDEGKRKKAKHSYPSLMTPGNKLHDLHFKIQCATIVDGVQHSPEACGAPDFTALAAELRAKLSTPPLPSLTTVHPPKDAMYPNVSMESPALLTVGPEHDRLLSTDVASLTPTGSWNSISRPYGLKPGSSSPVIAVGGNYNASIFLHTDGSLSGSGSDSDLVMSIDVSERMNEQHQQQEQDDSSVPRLPIVSRHTYSQTKGHIYIPSLDKVGIPVAADLPGDVSILSMKTGCGGSLAVDSYGRLWGCGIHVGLLEPGALYQELQVLDKQAEPGSQ